MKKILGYIIVFLFSITGFSQSDSGQVVIEGYAPAFIGKMVEFNAYQDYVTRTRVNLATAMVRPSDSSFTLKIQTASTIEGIIEIDLTEASLYIAPNTNTLVVIMNTYNVINEEIMIPDIPMNKWVHITLSVINKNVDIYVNGYLKKRCLLNGVPRQNDGAVYINSFGGFKGFLSRVRYFNYALPVWKIEQIMKQGPSNYQSPDLTEAVPPYLSYGWWEQKYGMPSN